MGFFSNRTIYQVVATFEIIFSILITSFSINIILILQPYEEHFWTEDTDNLKTALIYSCTVGIILSIIQVIASVLLVLKSKTESENNRKVDPGITPKLWLLQSLFQMGFLAFMFSFPLKYTIQSDMIDLKKSVKEFFTYTITCAMFKLLFMWAIYTTVHFRKPKNKYADNTIITTGNSGDKGDII